MESRTRTAGVLLLVLGLVVTEYVPTRWMQSMQSGSMPNYRALSALLAIGPVLIVLGAGFLAVSVVLRGLVHRQGTRFIRWQLATGVALIAAGIAARVWGDEVGNNLVDFLGPTGQAGFEVTRFVLTVFAQMAAALGVALVVVIPLQVALRDRRTADVTVI